MSFANKKTHLNNVFINKNDHQENKSLQKIKTIEIP
jgi:hypothetical protein